MSSFLLCLAVLVLPALGCGQNEGGRCQINSDCASGLVCSEGTTGNGVCRPTGAPGTGVTDASIGEDVAEDLAAPAAPEAGPDVAEVEPDASVDDTAASESGVSESGAID